MGAVSRTSAGLEATRLLEGHLPQVGQSLASVDPHSNDVCLFSLARCYSGEGRRWWKGVERGRAGRSELERSGGGGDRGEV